jgi:hypothetical protein
METKGNPMQVTVRFDHDTREETAAVVERLRGYVLLQKELPSVRWLSSGFYFDTDRSPMMFLADLEREGFHFDDFKSIEFSH